MNLTDDKIINIFYLADDFLIQYNIEIEKKLIGKNEPKRKPTFSQSEVTTILTLFHAGQYRNFKHFYIGYVQKHLTHMFPKTVSYNRFVELAQYNVLFMTYFLQLACLGECTGIAFTDSTPIKVCNNKRIKRNKVFKGIAELGKSTIGYFYGFKLHIMVNDKGELLNFMITKGNCDDRKPLENEAYIKNIFGKVYADKGYISHALFASLFDNGIHLVTGIKNNMKNSLMNMHDKIMLRKRSVIETINDELKNICQVEHTRHRSFMNFLSNLLAGLINYCFLDKKPAIKYEMEKTIETQLRLF